MIMYLIPGPREWDTEENAASRDDLGASSRS